jgi:hypothetical protein
VLNDALSCSNEEIRSFLKFTKSGLLTVTLVSSAHKTGLELLLLLQASHLYKRERVLVQALIPGAHQKKYKNVYDYQQ